MKRLLILTTVVALTAAAGCSTPTWCSTRRATTYAQPCAPICPPTCPSTCGEVGSESYFPSATSGGVQVVPGSLAPSLVTPGPEVYTPAN